MVRGCEIFPKTKLCLNPKSEIKGQVFEFSLIIVGSEFKILIFLKNLSRSGCFIFQDLENCLGPGLENPTMGSYEVRVGFGYVIN